MAVAAAGLDMDEVLWTQDTHIAASIFDAVQQLTYLTQLVNTGKGKPKPKAPKPYPRPGVKRKARAGGWFPGKTIVC